MSIKMNGLNLKGFLSWALMVLLCGVCHAGSIYDGIWQDKNIPSNYYTIHFNGSTLVFVDLSRIEKTGNTLSGTYLMRGAPVIEGNGSANFKKLEAVRPLSAIEDQRDLIFSPTGAEASTNFLCPICTTLPMFIKKIFPLE